MSYKILENLNGYDFKFDTSEIGGMSFSGEEKIKFLKKNGYSITQISYIETQKETDEFEAGTYTRRKLIALKKKEKIECNNNYFPQEYGNLFAKEIKIRMKKIVLNETR